jgi:serine/threonine protein kinase
MTLQQGTRLGHYEIRSLVGAGGLGEIYLANDLSLHRPVGIKLLPADLAADEDRLERLQHEAYAASSLNHPNILTIFEIGREVSLTSSLRSSLTASLWLNTFNETPSH